MNSVQYLRTGPLVERIRWQVATVRDLREETAETRTLVLDVPDWRGHLAGQHVDVRLTAEDGYQAERSYSIASAPESPSLELTVEHVPDGEVSTYFVEDLLVGDRFEVRGPIGGHFTWRVEDERPRLGGLLPQVADGRDLPADPRCQWSRPRNSSTRRDAMTYERPPPMTSTTSPG